MPSFFLLMQRQGAVVRAIPCKANTVGKHLAKKVPPVLSVLSYQCDPVPFYLTHTVVGLSSACV